MATETSPEIVLYDLACTKNVCFSPTVWRIRLMLNYKGIAYQTVFLEFPDIEPTLKGLGVVPPDPGRGSKPKYTVPTIHHLASNKFITDSPAIAQFVNATYPDPPLPLTSDLGRDIESKGRRVVGTIFRTALMPRETGILSPRAGEYFRRTREASLGHRLEDLLEGDKEEQVWKAMDGEILGLGELMRTNKAGGPFVLGAQPTLTDFFIAGSLQNAKMLHEATFQRIVGYPGFGDIYEACRPWMEKAW